MTRRPRSPRTRRTNIVDVARAAGVSSTTVSHALNDVAGTRVSAETRARVREVATRLGYSPSRFARGLRLQRTHTIGMVSDQIATTPYAGKMILGAQQAALDNGWWLLLVNTDGDPGVEAASITYLRQHDCDGVVLAWMYHRMVDVPDALAGVPTVLLDAESRDVSIPAVVPDEVAGGRAAVATLLEAGHRRIGFITNVDDIPATSGRLQGYREALRQAGVRFDRRLVTTDESVTAGGYRAAERLLAAAEPPTALFCFNDRMAMGAYRAASERGLRIPQDLSIVGFDDQQIIAEGLFPALTTVALPHLEMGRWAVERMIELIENPESTSPNPYLMRCPVVVRDSVGPPPC